jgi:tRNA(fMet)-specific endonuclease VapC
VFNGWVVKINGVGMGADFVGLYGDLWKSLDYLRSSRVLKFDRAADVCFRGLLQQYPELRKHRIQRDVRIAAIALSVGATVVTRNRRDFELVSGLQIVDWSAP